MKIKTYAKIETETLHVAGVNSDLVAKFKEFVERSGAPASFFLNQLLSEFVKATDTRKPKAAKKAAA